MRRKGAATAKGALVELSISINENETSLNENETQSNVRGISGTLWTSRIYWPSGHRARALLPWATQGIGLEARKMGARGRSAETPVIVVIAGIGLEASVYAGSRGPSGRPGFTGLQGRPVSQCLRNPFARPF